MSDEKPKDDTFKDERAETLANLERLLDLPLAALGFVWFAILVIEYVQGLDPLLMKVETAVWALFILDFTARLALSTDRLKYIRSHWLQALSLALPALRALRLAGVFRAARALKAARFARGARLLRLLSSVNKMTRYLDAVFGRKGLSFVLSFTLVVVFAGAAGMYSFERETGSEGFKDFTSSLWWTSMIMTTMGSQHWPRTLEGRVLCFILALYAFSVFGYITAFLASVFVGIDKKEDKSAAEDMKKEIESLKEEVKRLKEKGEGRDG